MPLEARTNFANRVNADYFISAHRNSYPLPVANGVETWVYKNTDSNTICYAKAIQDELVKAGVQSNRGVKKGNFHVCRETSMPSVLIELGFIKNAKDNELYDTKFNAYVEAIVKAVCKHSGITYKSVESAKPVQDSSCKNKTDELHRVQLGAFTDKSNAEHLKSELESKGYKAIIV